MQSLRPVIPVAISGEFWTHPGHCVYAEQSHMMPGTKWLVGPQSQWLRSDLPAPIGAHSFVLLSSEDPDELLFATLDESEHLVPHGLAEPCLDAKWQPGPHVLKASGFPKGVMKSRALVQRGTDALVEAQSIVMRAGATRQNGDVETIEGLYRLDEKVLAPLKSGARVALFTPRAASLWRLRSCSRLSRSTSCRGLQTPDASFWRPRKQRRSEAC